MGGKNRIRQKLLSIIGGAENAISDEEMETWMQNQVIIPIDHTFPKYVRENIVFFESIDFIAKPQPSIE